MTPLTPKQVELLRFINGYAKRNHCAPSYTEMRRHMGYRSNSSVANKIKILVDRGYIHRTKYAARSITVLRMPVTGVEDPAAVEIHALKMRIAELEGELNAYKTLYPPKDPKRIPPDAFTGADVP